MNRKEEISKKLLQYLETHFKVGTSTFLGPFPASDTLGCFSVQFKRFQTFRDLKVALKIPGLRMRHKF